MGFWNNDDLKNTISIEDNGVEIVIKATDNGGVLINGKEIDNLNEVKIALNLIIRAIAAPYNK